MSYTAPPDSCGFPRKNIEGESEFDIPWPEREPGITALVRLRNEATWLRYSIESIIDKVDRIGLFLQGEQTDRTDEIAQILVDVFPERIYCMRYPYISWPNGPGHNRIGWESAFSRAYFYNWCMGHSTTTHVIKWDGDCIAFDDLDIRELARRSECAFIRGRDMADLHHISVHPLSGRLPIFRVQPGRHWRTGELSEVFIGSGPVIPGAHFLHLKWLKPEESITKAWPENWREIPHFQKIWDRRRPMERYEGPYPSCLIPLIS